ncbi:hypothetical protein LWC34_06670 [Kibdelosporangium philippinense]|uniref:Uncharacterized protein n=1 Tax=Kibdelosporangium philippinense TaxID=211113 RepID=A0ABS8Z646_9PSEU|nr:hypothetical protein [Kibdelosporangium philippinense]MCE7002514.1 hypothetical protein [Kibdelosporangium philippinense]
MANAESIGEGAGANSYIFLATVARVIGQQAAAKTFKARSDQRDGPPTVLDNQATAWVEIAFRTPTKAMTTVVKTLARQIP